jgi:hypothetical protein
VPSGADTLVVVVEHSAGVTAANFNSSAMTLKDTQDNTDGIWLSVYEVTSLPALGDYTLAFSFSGTSAFGSIAWFFLSDTNESRAAVSTGGAFNSASSLTPTSVEGDFVVDFFGTQSTGTVTQGASQSLILDDYTIGGTSSGRLFISSKAGGAPTTTMEWSVSSSQRHAHIALAYIPAIVSGPTLTSGAVTSQATDGFTLGFTTDTANGTAYYVVYPTTSAAPSAAQIVAGTDGADVAATVSGSKSVTATGAQTFTAITGLNPGTTYAYSIVHYGVPA